MLGDPIAWLEAHGAQRDVLDGLRDLSRDWRTLWRDCPRGDWLLGIATRIGIDHVALVRAAIGCARTSIDLLDGDDEVTQAVATSARELLELAARWADGGASAPSGEEIASATRALEALTARVNDPSADAAARAVQAVGLGVADREVLAAAPAFAAEATIVSAAIDCALPMAMGWAHRACADAVRTAVPWELVESCEERQK